MSGNKEKIIAGLQAIVTGLSQQATGLRFNREFLQVRDSRN